MWGAKANQTKMKQDQSQQRISAQLLSRLNANPILTAVVTKEQRPDLRRDVAQAGTANRSLTLELRQKS